MPIGVMKNGTILVVVAIDLPSPRMLGGASKVNHFEFHSYTMTFIQCVETDKAMTQILVSADVILPTLLLNMFQELILAFKVIPFPEILSNNLSLECAYDAKWTGTKCVCDDHQREDVINDQGDHEC